MPTDSASGSEQWWLRGLGNLLIWARLRISATGSAQVFDCDGRSLPYDSEDSARAALLDAEFVALDGLDDDDANMLGLDLARLLPPQANSDAELRERMIQPLVGRQ